MPPIDRRTCLQRLALGLSANAIASLPFTAAAADNGGLTGKETAAMAELAKAFMEKYQVPGFSIAFARDQGAFYTAAFGMANEAEKEKLRPDHLFRIASIAKPVTAVAIFKLVEEGKLKTDDKIFGSKGLLSSKAPKKSQAGLEDITVHHLLTHTCGGWGNDGSDPMFQHAELDHDELIEITLREQPLKHAPGETYAYSNFGYCLLGRVIEKASGKNYDDYVKSVILKPSGITDMEIAGNTLEDRTKHEVVYYGRDGEDPYGMNVRRMDAHGGWLATPSDIVRLLLHSSGDGTQSDLLRPGTVTTMVKGTAANPGYSSGWGVNESGNRWHSGSLPGTSTIAVRTGNGLCWAGFSNSRSGDIHGALDKLMWDMARAVPAWKV